MVKYLLLISLKLRLRDIPLPTRINLQPLHKGDSHQVSKDKCLDLLMSEANYSQSSSQFLSFVAT